MKNILCIFVVVLLVMGLQTALAQVGENLRIGTAGGQELLIPVGSRGAAMGGAVAATSFGLEGLYWNPGGLAYLEGTEVMASHQSYIADIDVEYIAIGRAIEDFGVIGFSLKVVNIGEWEETTIANPNGTGRFFTPTLSVMGLSWAKTLTNHVSFGFTGQFIMERIFEVSASGFAADFGFLYETGYKGLMMGLVMKNYGPDLIFSGKGFDRVYTEIGGRPLSSDNAAAELPTSVNISLAYNVLEQEMSRATLSGNFAAYNQGADQWQGGLEYAYDEKFFFRAGYKYADQEDYIYGASFGAGVKVPVGDVNLTIEYAWMDTEFFDANQFFTFKAGF